MQIEVIFSLISCVFLCIFVLMAGAMIVTGKHSRKATLIAGAAFAASVMILVFLSSYERFVLHPAGEMITRPLADRWAIMSINIIFWGMLLAGFATVLYCFLQGVKALTSLVENGGGLLSEIAKLAYRMVTGGSRGASVKNIAKEFHKEMEKQDPSNWWKKGNNEDGEEPPNRKRWN